MNEFKYEENNKNKIKEEVTMTEAEKNKETEPTTSKSLIGLGFEYILKDISITKTYLKQVGLSDENIESITNSSELKELREEDLTAGEQEKKLRDFYQSLAENYKGKFQEDVRKVAAEMLENSKKEE